MVTIAAPRTAKALVHGKRALRAVELAIWPQAIRLRERGLTRFLTKPRPAQKDHDDSRFIASRRLWGHMSVQIRSMNSRQVDLLPRTPA